MFSQTTEYALRATVWLAQNTGTPQTTQQIAEATKVPLGYLAKVLQALGKAGVVRSARGLHGGFELVKAPEMVSILEIIAVVEPIRRIRSCPLDLNAHRLKLCPLHKKMDQALAMIEETFSSTTLADIVNTPSSSKPLCDVMQVRLGGARA